MKALNLVLIFLSLLLISCAQSAKKGEAAEDLGVPSEEAPADQVNLKNHAEEITEPEQKEEPKKAERLSDRPLPKDKAAVRDRIVQVENESLGDKKKKTMGLIGDLKACRMKLSSKAYGGDGALFWDEPSDRLSEKWLSDSEASLQEYQAVLMIVRYRRDYLSGELSSCENELGKRKHDASLGTAVTITEGDSDNDDRVHRYMCGFVGKNALLKDFLIQTFSRGLLQLENFDLNQELLVASLKDEKGSSKKHGLMFMGWRLSFNQGPVTLSDVLFTDKEVKLKYWSFSQKEKVEPSKSCLAKGVGVWN